MDKTKVFLVSPKHKQAILEDKSPIMRIVSRIITELENPNIPIVIIDTSTANQVRFYFYKDKMISTEKLPFNYNNVYFASAIEEFYEDMYDYMSEIQNSVYPDCNGNEFEAIFEKQCSAYEKQFIDVFVIKI